MLFTGIISSLVLVTLTTVLIWLAFNLADFYKKRYRVLQLPGPPHHWFYGDIQHLPRDITKVLEFFRGIVKQFPRCCHLNLGPHRAQIYVHHPETVKQILKTSEPKYTAQLGPYKYGTKWLGDGLLLSSGDKWRRNRRLLTPAFHFDILRPYIDVYNQSADVLINKWVNKAHSSPSGFNIYSDVSLCTLDVILKCAFAYEEDVQTQGENHPYVQAVARLTELLQRRIFNPLYQIDKIYFMLPEGKELLRACDFVHEVSERVIQSRKQTLSSGKADEISQKKYKDFLDILLLARDEDGKGLDDAEIRDEVDTFLFEGHDTTASAIAWILHALATHPEYQARARAEVDALGEGPVTWDDMNKLPYLTQCIKEGLRLHTPVPFSSRQLTKPMVMDGVEILPGTGVVIGTYMLHHNPAIWGEDHKEYKPDRFLPENINKMDSHAFCPFAAGPRNCIGQNFALNEQKTVLSRLLQRFEFSVDESNPAVIEVPSLVMRSLNGIHIKVIPRATRK